MTLYKTPSRNCPACCPKKFYPSSTPVRYPNGQLSADRGYLQHQENRELHIAAGAFGQNPKPKSWREGPRDEMALEFGSIGEIAEAGIGLLKNHWTISCAEVGAAVKYLRHLWLTTNGNYSQKTLLVNRMICFYLILLGIYIAESAFWVNQQLLQGLCRILLKPKRNVDMLMGLGAVVFFIFLLYLIGGPASSPGICNRPE